MSFLFLIVLITTVFCEQNKYCQLSCDYVTQTISHTVCDRAAVKCGPTKSCGPDFKIVALNDILRQYILDLHNYLRNKVAMGNETRGNQPSAANMNIMRYNKELEFVAQCWANTCNGNPLIHDKCRRTEKFDYVGQNLGFINTSLAEFNVKSAVKDLVMSWYDEVEIFDHEWVRDTRDRGPNIKVGHYTQMIWADTSEIGCAASYYTTNGSIKWHHFVLVCNYGPGGNYLTLPVYHEGKPCSRCPSDSKRNKMFKGLCGESKDLTRSNRNIFNFL